MARYQPQGGRGPQSRGMLPARRQLPPPEPPVRQRALTALLLGVLSLIGLMLGLGNLRRGIFVAILTLLFAATAIWLGVTASRKARRGGTARPRWAVGGVVLGSLGLVFSALWLLVLAVFWPQLNTYYTCMGGANTVAAQQTCHDQFTKSVGSEISVLQNGRLRVTHRRPRG
jgi:drug/metabolite transporter (DMT)-like permease